MSQTPQMRPPRRRPRAAGGHSAATAALLSLLLALAGCAGSTPEPPPEPSAASQPPQADAEPPGREAVKPSAPVRYTVQRGDTLWDIAARFLRDPWVWPEVWQVNPQIDNPHLIYPGDVITLTWAGDEPRLQVQPASERETRRLEPRIRREPLDGAIDSIPADAIRQFLNRPRLATAEEIDSAPYIVGNYEGRLISATGNRVFAKGFEGGQAQAAQYDVVRAGEALRDPETDDVLAYELIHAGKAHVVNAGPPARLELAEIRREVLNGDRLMPPGRGLTQGRYIPQVPAEDVSGQIIHLVDAISQVGTNQVVVVNLGQTQGLEIGHVLAVEQSGGTVDDPHVDRGEGSRVQLPPQRVGTMMLFKVFDEVGYGIVLEAEQPIQRHDDVVRP